MDDAPLVKITRGNPTAEELAALVGIVMMRSRPLPRASAPVASTWARSGRPAFTGTGRTSLRSGPGTWRESGLPR